jgi:hypothetical protein
VVLKPGGQPTPKGPQPVRTALELARLLNQRLPHTHAVVHKDLNLTEGDEEAGPPVGGLVFAGPANRDLLIEGQGNELPTIKLTYNPAAVRADPWAGLTVRGGTVTLRRLRFEVNAAVAPADLLAAVVVHGGVLTLEQCEFVQNLPATAPGRRSLPVAAVAVENANPAPGAPRPRVVLRECYFRQGQDAVALTGPADIEPSNCAFGPHAALFHLRGPGRPSSDALLDLKNCSALVVRGPAFRLDKGATCRLAVQNSLFSRPGGAEGGDARANLIWQTGETKPGVRYQGRHNVFHNLNAFWLRETVTDWGWEDFKNAIKGARGTDEGSAVLDATVSPWLVENPLQQLDEPKVAFQVKPDLPQVRQEDPTRPVGVEVCVWGPSYAGPLPRLGKRPEGVAAAEGQKVVDPDAKPGTAGVYRLVSQAVGDARPGDVILIRHNGPVPINPIPLVEANHRDLTLKPFPGFHPVLTLGKADERKAALFRLHDGQLKFEGLEFLIKPDQPEFESQAVVEMVGNGHCSFKQCVVTLEDAGGVRASVVRLADPGDTMIKMPTRVARTAPEVRLQDCFVRGQGDLLAVRASRPFDLEANNVLVALAGSFLTVDGNAKEPAPGSDPQVVRLARVTAYLTEHLVYLRAGKTGKGLVPTRVKSASDCLFAAAGGKTLVHLSGLDSEEVDRVFAWEGRHNAYSNFERVLDQRPLAEEGMAPKPFDQDRWQTFAKESDPQPLFLKVKFDVPSPEERPLAEALPAMFKVKADPKAELQDYGADIDQLPQPSGTEAVSEGMRDEG